MIVIVDSGSTKADWVAIHPDGQRVFFETSGINPSTQATLQSISQNEGLISALKAANYIFFYAAGVIGDDARNKVSSWLRGYGNTGSIVVESDMLGAAKACCGDESGLVCILGTGSNSCIYDGQNITDNIPALGYILGDEGSGSYLGKEILRSYFCRKMPVNISNQFYEKYKLSKQEVIEQLYINQKGSKYIANFATFLNDVEDGDWKSRILLSSFRAFIDFRICSYEGFGSYPIHFIGSVAFHYHEQLKQALAEFGLESKTFIQKPILSLIDYHFKQIYK